VDRLESRGLVRRTQDATDRRRTRITVVDKVTRYVGELEAGPSGRLCTALERASAAQRRAIMDALRLLRDLLDAAGTTPSS
jgi:DNA-binding MarR family transcriptional regulator